MSEPGGKIDLVFAVDRAFLPYTAVAAWSALRHTQGRVHIHVLQDGRLGGGIDRFRQMVVALGGSATFYQVDDAKLANLPVTDHVSLATYYRLSVAELLPADIQRVIYLDGDLIVRSCLSELSSWPTAPRGVAVVPEPSDSCRRLGLPSESSYFNAGVLVLDLGHWRREGVTAELYDIARTSREQLRFWDQDVLALYLQGQFSPLPSQWNVTHRCFFGSSPLPMPDQPPAIVHFSGAGLKPWNRNVAHPYADEFWQLAAQVRPFGFRIQHPHRRRLLDRWQHFSLGRRRAS